MNKKCGICCLIMRQKYLDEVSKILAHIHSFGYKSTNPERAHNNMRGEAHNASSLRCQYFENALKREYR